MKLFDAGAMRRALMCGLLLPLLWSQSSFAATQAEIERIRQRLVPPVVSPGVSLGTPVGFGARWGHLFGAVGTLEQIEGRSNDLDGSISLGMGFGNPNRSVGLEVVANIISTTTGFNDTSNVDVKLHRRLGRTWGLAVGAENLFPRGQADLNDISYFGTVSKVFHLRPRNLLNSMPIVATFGLGSELFKSPDRGGDARNGIAPIGSIGFIFHPQFSAIVDWSGQLSVGLSVVPLKRLPISLVVGVFDLTGSFQKRTSDGQFSGSNPPRFGAALGGTLDFTRWSDRR